MVSLAQVKNAMLDGDVNQADWLMNNLIKQHSNNPVLTLFYINHFIDRNFGREYLANYQYYIHLCEKLVKDNQQFYSAQVNLARYYIMMGFNEKALKLIDKIPDSVTDYYILPCKAWACYQRKDWVRHNSIWDFIAKIIYPSSIVDKQSTLKKVKKQSIGTNKQSILHFSCCYNEIDKLPLFLNHYRSLGVKVFYIVDNQSTDGSYEFLLQQKDVELFSTTESYRQSVYGVSWINTLIDIFASGQWVIHTDIDELLIYPNCESTDLHGFTRLLDSQNQKVVKGFMLDMFPKNIDEFHISKDLSLQEQHCYFLNNYLFLNDCSFPYQSPRGGIFSVLLNGKNIMLSKTPIFKTSDKIKLLSSSHITTPPVSIENVETTCALLHFKLVGNAAQKFKNEIIRNQHADHSSNYKAYSKALQSLDSNADLSKLPNTTKYIDSHHLLQLGLIKDFN